MSKKSNNVMTRFKFVKLILLLIFAFSLKTCFFERDFEYNGDYPELFTVAVNSILGARGYIYGPIAQPIIAVLEEDDYGRVLFSYSEGASNIGPSMTNDNRVIMQRVEGDYVYFYSHYNFISSSFENNRWEFTEEDIESLKDANNWNQEMSDNSQFTRVRIVRQKEEGPITNEQLINVYNEIFPGSGRSDGNIIAAGMTFLRIDDYGRSVYLARGSGSEWIGTFVAVLFQPDHSFDLDTGILEITDVIRYQTELRLFMEANGWNEPWDD